MVLIDEANVCVGAAGKADGKNSEQMPLSSYAAFEGRFVKFAIKTTVHKNSAIAELKYLRKICTSSTTKVSENLLH